MQVIKKLFSRFLGSVTPNGGSDSSSIATAVRFILIGVIGFFLFAMMVPLDEGISVKGTVVYDAPRYSVQHLQGGRVKQIHVSEGQEVKRGDILVTLDDVATQANFEFARAELRSRLTDLQSIKARHDALKSIMDERSSQLSIFDRRLVAVNEMVELGFLPAVTATDLQAKVLDLRNQISDGRAQLFKAQQDVFDLESRINAARTRLVSAETDNQSMTIRAPIDGQVVGLAAPSPGGVIAAGQKVCDVAPKDEKLVVEIQVNPPNIDRVTTESEVTLRFTSFSDMPQLTLEGKLISIASDVVKQADPNIPPFYIGRVDLKADQVELLKGRNVQPGMGVEAVIKTGDRTLLSYITGPLIRRFKSSMKEH